LSLRTLSKQAFPFLQELQQEVQEVHQEEPS
jgi:hypothetical protein